MEKFRKLMKKKKENISSIELNIRKRIRMQILVLASSILLVVVLIFAMTAAWFTNVATTSSLSFETESWGFDESRIMVSSTPISIAPGASGIVPLSVDNSEAEEIAKVSVSISKAMMLPEELQKRIYFYADTSKTVTFSDGITEWITEEGTVEEGAIEEGATEETVVQETVSKIYLGASAPDNYTYTILPGQILTMNELYCNDVPIKWEWVYDMLGYYFRGTVDASAENPVITDEYLRPIEYDYNEAVFDKENTQQLQQIGAITREEFLTQISSEDGYFGTINEAEAVAIVQDDVQKLYYPVEVDSNGYGIWAYLCNYSEVEEGIAYDTQLAEAGQTVTAEATIFLTAYSMAAQTESVYTEAALKAALTDADIDVVELATDISTGSTITLAEGMKVLDLNGYNLTYDGLENEYELISVSDGATLIVTDGEITGNSTATGTASKLNSKAMEAVGGNIVLNGVKISGVDSAVVIADYAAETAGDSVIQITNSDLTAAQATIFLQGNGSASDTMTRVIVQNSKITSQYNNAINGQGSTDRWGTELILADSEINGYYGGIYQPQQKSATTITNCTVTGNTGIILKGGTMNIYDSTIQGTGEVDVNDAAIVTSGYTDTGDGIYVEAGYAWSTSLILKGQNKVISDKAYAVEMIGETGKGPGRILIYDNGTYTGNKGDANWNGIGTFEIYGGTFTNGTVNATITRYDVEEQQGE